MTGMCRISQLQVDVLNILTEIFPFHSPSWYDGIVSYSRPRSIFPMPLSIYPSLLFCIGNCVILTIGKVSLNIQISTKGKTTERSKEDQIKSHRHYYWKLCHG